MYLHAAYTECLSHYISYYLRFSILQLIKTQLISICFSVWRHVKLIPWFWKHCCWHHWWVFQATLLSLTYQLLKWYHQQTWALCFLSTKLQQIKLKLIKQLPNIADIMNALVCNYLFIQLGDTLWHEHLLIDVFTYTLFSLLSASISLYQFL